MDGPAQSGHNWDVRRRLMWVMVTLCVAAYIPLSIWGLATWDAIDPATWAWMVGVVPSMVAAGAFLTILRPENPVGEVAVWGGLSMFMIPAILEVPTVIIHGQSGPQPWMWAAMWLAMTSSAIGFVLLLALVVILPDGRLRHRRERRLLQVAAATVLIPTLSLFTNPTVVTHSQSFVGVDEIASPVFVSSLEIPGTGLSMLSNLAFALFLVAVWFQIRRYRAGSERERKQVRWVLFGGVSAIVLGVFPTLLETFGLIPPIVHGSLASLIIAPVFFIFTGSVVIAVLEPSWIDVDIVIRKSFVYGALSFLILLLYVAAASAFGVAAGSRLQIEIAVVLTVVIALAFQPARRRLQLVADRWVFGARPSKYEAVTEFGETLEQASDPTELLPQLVDTIRNALRLAWARAYLDDGSIAATGDTDESDPALTVPIRAAEETFGSIECGPKTEGTLDHDEKQLVRTLAGQVGLAVMNARLAGRIVTAAESERRRIERNIHDGAQQELVALVAQLGMARSAAARGELRPEEIDQLREEARHILVDLRELAQGIHPSVLSDGGILEAVEERCAHLPLDVTLEAPETLRNLRFEDDVEGAAYFFVTESLANVLKHSEASRAVVSLAPENGRLHLSVRDDGRGFDPGVTSLHGIAGLRDRIQALGGQVTIQSRPGEGTSFGAVLPTD